MGTMSTNMAPNRKSASLRGKAPAKRHRSPRSGATGPHLSPGGRGRPSEARPGEGDCVIASEAERSEAISGSGLPNKIASSRLRAPCNDGQTPHPTPLPNAETEQVGVLGAGALYRLMAWLSPAYPVGAFSYSSGLEWAVEADDVKDAASLKRWLATVIAHGSGFCDAVFFAHAHRAALRDDDSLRAVAELAAAFAPSKERHLETTAQGGAFVAATRAAWPCAALERLCAEWDGPIAYPVAVGVAAAGQYLALAPALQAFLHALTANMISAGLRLIPLGQSDGQRVLAMLEPSVHAAAARALITPLDEVGGAAFRADLASMRHETQYTRLFRS